MTPDDEIVGEDVFAEVHGDEPEAENVLVAFYGQQSLKYPRATYLRDSRRVDTWISGRSRRSCRR